MTNVIPIGETGHSERVAESQRKELELKDIRTRVFEAQSITRLVRDSISSISGDEDPLDLVAGPLCNMSYALEAESRILNEVAARLEAVAPD